MCQKDRATFRQCHAAGGVTETRFGTRAVAETASALFIKAYAALSERAAKIFGAIASSRSQGTSDGVVDVIFTAATDNSDRLRYVATDGIKPWVAARRETSEDDYIALIRAEVGLSYG